MKPKSIEECGCCEVGIPPTPEEIRNRPGLPGITYRIGTYTSFRQAMIEAIAKSPELKGWAARKNDDYGIALMEMWAYLADILTFYQERLASEAFIRTALHRGTVMRLANMLDYKLNPGAAAAVYLAFCVEENECVKIPVGLRVQSLPGQDEKPQKFETVEKLSIESGLNKFRVYPIPDADTPLEAGRNAATVISDVKHLSPGDSLVIFKEKSSTEDSSGNVCVEDKRIKELRKVDWQQELEWVPANVIKFPSGSRMYKWVRKFRLFGHNAPARFLVPSTSNGAVIWHTVTYQHVHDPGYCIDMDVAYDDLKENTELLVVSEHDGVVKQVTVTNVQLIEASITGTLADGSENSVPLMQTTVTRATVNEELPSLDSRRTVIYELEGDAVELWEQKYEPTLEEGSEAIYAPLSELGIDGSEVERFMSIGRKILLSDETGKVNVGTVTGCSVEGQDHLKIAFTPGLACSLEAGTTILHGNIVKATHGETIAVDVLGSGNTSSVFQSFTLRKSPTTFVPAADAPRGAKNTLNVRVSGVLWKEEGSLYGQKPNDQVYTTSVNNDGQMRVQFGDGKTGARLPTGRDNVTATYRQGLGSEGNVRADSLTTLLDKPVGIKSVINPKDAEGGTDPESVDDARTNAPNTVRTFERAISLRDYEDIARGYTGIAKARAARVFKDENEMIQLTIAGENDQKIERASETYKSFLDYLNLHRDINQPLDVVPHASRPLILDAVIQVHPSYVKEKVVSAVKTAALSYFNFNSLQLGQGIHLSDIYKVLQNVKGVKAVHISALCYRTAEEQSLETHLRIEADQIAKLEAEDLKITSDLTQEG
jgi:uncharacterized phage protein gp47/JayE